MFYLISDEVLVEQSQNLSDLELIRENGMFISETFPPTGKKFENGEWRDKTIEEKVIDGDISKIARVEQLKSQILDHSEKLCELGVDFKETKFQAREKDLLRMNNALTKIDKGGIWRGSWRDRNDDWVSITEEELTQLALICADFWEECFRISRILSDELYSLTITELASYNIETKWNNI